MKFLVFSVAISGLMLLKTVRKKWSGDRKDMPMGLWFAR